MDTVVYCVKSLHRLSIKHLHLPRYLLPPPQQHRLLLPMIPIMLSVMVAVWDIPDLGTPLVVESVVE